MLQTQLVDEQVRGAQPLLTPDDCSDAEEIAKADAQVQQLLKQRGITDLDLVAADPWSVVRGFFLCSHIHRARNAPQSRIGEHWQHLVSLTCWFAAHCCQGHCVC